MSYLGEKAWCLFLFQATVGIDYQPILLRFDSILPHANDKSLFQPQSLGLGSVNTLCAACSVEVRFSRGREGGAG